MIAAKQINKKFGNIEVLKNIDVEVNEGQFVAITGPSGAGKSTLLQILGTLENADSGTLFLQEKNIAQLKAKQIASLRNESLGFIFQFHHLLPEFTALENVSMPLLIKGMNRQKAAELAQEKLEEMGLSHRLTHKPSSMSGGEQQRVAIARALVYQPKYIFADEPTGNLDSENAKAIHQLFRNLADTKKYTIIVVTHNEELASLADRIIKMQDGRIVP